jgi:DnaK suppressor protein
MAKEKKSASKDKKAKDMKKKKTTTGKPVKKSTAKVSVDSKNKAATKKSKTRTKATMVKSKTRKKELEILDAESTAAARAKALEKIKGYSKKDLEHFRKIIIERQNEIIEQLQNLKDQMMDPTTGEYINENSPYSLHMAEQGTDAMEREKTFLYAQRENKFLGYLEEALKRIDAGTYGICIECIEKPQHLCETCPLIPKARLEAVPHSQLCLPMKQKQEKK